MGMRKYERQIARARLTALGVGKVNRNMWRLWRKALTGKTGEDARRAQMKAGARAMNERKRRKGAA